MLPWAVGKSCHNSDTKIILIVFGNLSLPYDTHRLYKMSAAHRGGNRKKERILALFGARVRELRIKRNWTQEELGERAGRHWTYIGGIERGERNITLLVVEDVARALGVKVRDLFDSSGEGKDE